MGLLYLLGHLTDVHDTTRNGDIALLYITQQPMCVQASILLCISITSSADCHPIVCRRRSAASQVSALASAIGGAHPAGLAARVAAARSEHLRMGEHWAG